MQDSRPTLLHEWAGDGSSRPRFEAEAIVALDNAVITSVRLTRKV